VGVVHEQHVLIYIMLIFRKFDAIVESGIVIKERCAIPDELIPPDSRVEIDAKIAAGYFTAGKIPDAQALEAVKGRVWDDIQH
jgi:hypothetical protein